MEEYFAVGHGGDHSQTSFIPSGVRLLFYGPPGQNLAFTVGLSVIAATQSHWQQELSGGQPQEGVDNPEPFTNLELNSFTPEQLQAIEVNYGRGGPARLIISGRDFDSGIRLCSQAEKCQDAWALNSGQHADECTGLFNWLRKNRLSGVVPTDVTIHMICCLGEDLTSPEYREYNSDEGALWGEYHSLISEILGLIDEENYVTALNIFDTLSSDKVRSILLLAPRLRQSIERIREVLAPNNASEWWDPDWSNLSLRKVPTSVESILIMEDSTWLIILWRWLNTRTDMSASTKELCELTLSMARRMNNSSPGTEDADAIGVSDMIFDSECIPANIKSAFEATYSEAWLKHADSPDDTDVQSEFSNQLSEAINELLEAICKNLDSTFLSSFRNDCLRHL